MKKRWSFYFLCSLLSLSACNSTGTATEENDSDIENGIVVVVQETVRNREGLSNIDWPWSHDDYNIREVSDGIYNTSGEFEHGGKVYKFNIDLETDDGLNGKIKSYSVR